jgi:hypothetical protein
MRRLLGVALIITGTVLLAFTLPQPKDEFIWTQAVERGRAAWPEACAEPRRISPPRNAGPCAPGKWPLASLPLVAFNDELWVVQHSHTAWRSRDGVTWTQMPAHGGWGERYGMAQAFFKGHIYLMGGTTAGWEYRNDVWRSGDGTKWERVTAAAPWSPRRWHSVVVFQDKLWLIGGADDTRTDSQPGGRFNDVWNSSDGVHWTLVTERAPWPAGGPRAVVFADKLWLVGPAAGRDSSQRDLKLGVWFDYAAPREVWSSPDGKRWTRVLAAAPWSGRGQYGVHAFAGRLWVFGGMNDSGVRNDVWSSPDGVRWTQATEHAPWAPRTASDSVVFRQKLWLFGGKDGKHPFHDDIWVMQPASRLAQTTGP